MDVPLQAPFLRERVAGQRHRAFTAKLLSRLDLRTTVFTEHRNTPLSKSTRVCPGKFLKIEYPIWLKRSCSTARQAANKSKCGAQPPSAGPPPLKGRGGRPSASSAQALRHM